MRKLFILIVLAVALTGNVYTQTRSDRKNSVKLSPAETITNYEQQMREFIKRKDLKTFGSFVAEDWYGNLDGKDFTKPKLLESLGGANIKNFQLNNVRVTMMNKDAAIITYQIDEHLIVKGKEVLFHFDITSGWAKRGGRWLNVFFREQRLDSGV